MPNFVSQFTGLQIEDRLTKAGTAVQPEGLTKTAVGLGNVDNTSDLNKPISTATQQALDDKQNSLVSGTNIKTINGNSLLESGDLIVGGLQYLQELRNRASPNDTLPVHGVKATGVETNIDLLLQPKGEGAIIAQVPDGTTAGGNKRGANAVDLQTRRLAPTQVASGFISTIAGGSSNTASSQGSTVVGGDSNTASGFFSTIPGGSTNTASGFLSTVAGGKENTASGFLSTIPGGRNAMTNGIHGLLAYGFFGGALGQTQMSFFGGRANTTDATATRLTSEAASASATNQLTLRKDSAFRVRGTVVARNTSSNDCKEWTFEALIKRGADASSTAVVGTPSINSTFADAAAGSWSIDVTADTTNGALAVNAIGETGKTIRWNCVVYSVEVA